MITTRIEIARPPADVRKTVSKLGCSPERRLDLDHWLTQDPMLQLLDFSAYPQWHKGLFKSVTPLSEEDPFAVGNKLHCEMEGFTFDSVISVCCFTSFFLSFSYLHPSLLPRAGLVSPAAIHSESKCLTE